MVDNVDPTPSFLSVHLAIPSFNVALMMTGANAEERKSEDHEE
jgi:hypothetical protein